MNGKYKELKYVCFQKRCAASPYPCDQMADCRISNGKSTCTCAAGYDDYSEESWMFFGASGTSCRGKLHFNSMMNQLDAD